MLEIEIKKLVIVDVGLLSLGVDVVSAMLYKGDLRNNSLMQLSQVSLWFAIITLLCYLILGRHYPVCLHIFQVV